MTTVIYTSVAKGYGFRVLVLKGCFLLLSWHCNPTSILSYCHTFSTLMGRFGADDNYVIKKDYCYVICFYFVCWRMVQTMDPNRGARLEEMSRFPS